MIREYIEKALCHATVEEMEDGDFFASIPEINGPWGSGKSEAEARAELAETLEEWIVVCLREDDDIPEIDGVSLNFGGKRWSDQVRAAK